MVSGGGALLLAWLLPPLLLAALHAAAEGRRASKVLGRSIKQQQHHHPSFRCNCMAPQAANQQGQRQRQWQWSRWRRRRQRQRRRRRMPVPRSLQACSWLCPWPRSLPADHRGPGGGRNLQEPSVRTPAQHGLGLDLAGGLQKPYLALPRHSAVTFLACKHPLLNQALHAEPPASQRLRCPSCASLTIERGDRRLVQARAGPRVARCRTRTLGAGSGGMPPAAAGGASCRWALHPPPHRHRPCRHGHFFRV